MTEQEFAEALGFQCDRTNTLTLNSATRWLRLALGELLSIQEKPDLCGATVIASDGDGLVIQDPEGKLYGAFVAWPFGYGNGNPPSLAINQDSEEILFLLRDANALDKVVSPIAVAEYLRLRVLIKASCQHHTYLENH